MLAATRRAGDRVKRREILLAGAAGALLLIVDARAQPPARKYRIGVLWSVPESRSAPYWAALRERLAADRFVEGSNLVIDAVLPSAFDQLRMLVVERLPLKPDAIFALTTRNTEAALAATRSVPIVFAWVGDPVASGIVKDYARPGGNATGVSNRLLELAVKRLEFLRELLPAAKRVAIAAPMFLPEMQIAATRLREASRKLGFELMEVNAPFDARVSAIQSAIKNGAEGVLPLTVYTTLGEHMTGEQVVRLTVEQRIPAIFAESEMVEAGGLISYGTNLLEDVRRAAEMLARVLRGAKPADIPVDQASRFELAVNLKTARALGIRVPPTILARADRVIE